MDEAIKARVYERVYEHNLRIRALESEEQSLKEELRAVREDIGKEKASIRSAMDAMDDPSRLPLEAEDETAP